MRVRKVVKNRQKMSIKGGYHAKRTVLILDDDIDLHTVSVVVSCTESLPHDAIYLCLLTCATLWDGAKGERL
jgi:hypothetical protein